MSWLWISYLFYVPCLPLNRQPPKIHSAGMSPKAWLTSSKYSHFFSFYTFCQLILLFPAIQNIKASWNLRIIISNSCKQYAISFPWQFVPPLNQEKLTIALFKNFFLQTSFAMPCLINPVFRIRMYPMLSEANLNSEFRYPYNLIAIYYGMNKKSDHAFP